MPYVPTESGHWVNEKFAQIAEIIKDYDPSIELAWIPPEKRTLFDSKPYAVIHNNPANGSRYVMFYLSEEELDHRVLSRIFEGDTAKGNDSLAKLEAEERARQLVKLKAEMEEAEVRQDFIKTVVGSHKHSFKHNGRVIPK